MKIKHMENKVCFLFRFLKKNMLVDLERGPIVNLPSWFLSHDQTCFSLLNAYRNSASPIPTYDYLSNIFDSYCCSIDVILCVITTTILGEIFCLTRE